MLDTLQDRFNLLEPCLTAYGPKDKTRRPAVLLFHACNGVRDHIHAYAKQVADLGFRAYVVDSFLPRGWDENAAMSLVCTGLALLFAYGSSDVRLPTSRSSLRTAGSVRPGWPST